MGDDGRVSEPPAAPRVRLLGLIAILVLAVDVVTKVIAVAQLEGREPVELLGGLMYLQLIRNPGAAFSIATGYTWVLSLIALTVVVVIIRIARKLRSTGWAIALGLVLGGATGNLVDRIFRSPGPLRGHVVDIFSAFAPDGRAFPIFNIADCAVVCGGILLVLLALLGRELDGTRSGDEPAESAGTTSTADTAAETGSDAGSGTTATADSRSAESDGGLRKGNTDV